MRNVGGKNVNSKNSKANASNRGKNVAKNNSSNSNNNNSSQNNRNNSGSSSSKNQKNSASSAASLAKNKVQKINNLQAASANAGGNKSSSNRRLESYLMSVKDPSIRRWLSKSCTSSGSNCNDTRLQHLADKHQKKPPTPARKRSSLARPVRVHDSFPHENEPVIVDWNEDQNLRNQSTQQQMYQLRQRHTDDKTKRKHKDREDKRHNKHQPLDQAIDDLVEIRVDEEVSNLPIRLRLGEFFELSLPKCRRRKRRKRHRMMIATMREKTMKSMMEAGGMRAGARRQHGPFKDTEHLLKVLSINNVDQDNRYSVTRCSVM